MLNAVKMNNYEKPSGIFLTVNDKTLKNTGWTEPLYIIIWKSSLALSMFREWLKTIIQLLHIYITDIMKCNEFYLHSVVDFLKNIKQLHL